MNHGVDLATIVGGLAGLGLLAAILRLLLLRVRVEDFPYRAVDAALTPAERSFYGVLQQAAGGDFEIFAKMRLADVIDVHPGVHGSRRYTALNRIGRKHVHFVLCEPGTFRIVGAIELDDRSHLRDERRRRDDFVDSALAAAGMPILHVAARRAYSPDELRQQIAQHFRASLSKEPVHRTQAVSDAANADRPGVTREWSTLGPAGRGLATERSKPSTAVLSRYPRQTRSLVKLAAAMLFLMIVAAALRQPSMERDRQPATATTPSAQSVHPPTSVPGKPQPNQPPSPAAAITNLFAPKEGAGLVVGYRNVHVPGKPLEECMGKDNELNDTVRRCREGYTERVPIYR